MGPAPSRATDRPIPATWTFGAVSVELRDNAGTGSASAAVSAVSPQMRRRSIEASS